MSTRSASARAARGRPAPRSRRRRRRAVALRRRAGLLAVVGLLGLGAAMVIEPMLDKAAQEITLPLRHDDIIRQQAAEKGLDAALIAGVIYAESRFRQRTSPAGATGLMQIMPATADYIARKSGGTRFVQGDLATPQINISYGAWYLRYLLRRYGGNELLALAAYNAGEGKVDQWIVRHGGALRIHRIPFPETRAYVKRVLEARSQYRREYPRELGL